MQTLIILHLPSESSEHDRFQLDLDGCVTTPVRIPPAAGYPIKGRPQDDLMSELRWYLENFLEYPFPPETDHAERVLQALDGWATDVHDALFRPDDASALLASVQADSDDDEPLRLQVRSADPHVLSWPWESLLKLDAAQSWSLERTVDGLDDVPLAPVDDLPRERINILLVTCRPYEGDVDFRSISRPLVEMVETEKLPVDVHVLRPPTFERLQEHLEERPRHYHVLHFDGHGSYAPYMPQGEQGCLAFERVKEEKFEEHEVSAKKVSALLRQHGIPVVVLNACQSGMLDAAAETAFASVSAALLQAGTHSVVAMAYSLVVSGAVEFLPEFYRGFFSSGEVSTGMRRGRARMHTEKGRFCARGRFDLEDWLVPVLYQRGNTWLPFTELQQVRRKALEVFELGGDSPGAFVGRDGAILQIERAMRRPEGGILVHGLAGVGKTTLVRGFIHWLAQTEGLDGCFWFDFREVRSVESVLNRLGEPLVGPKFASMATETKVSLLAQEFNARRYLVVWANFEAIGDSADAGTYLMDEERAQLKAFISELRSASTKVLIVSHREEAWLRPELSLVALAGLQGEERWRYCEMVLGELGQSVDREDPRLQELMDFLDGHPLSMRLVLTELKKRQAGELLTALRSVDADDAMAKLYATLDFAVEALADNLRPLLVPLALHELFVDGDLLEPMARRLSAPPRSTDIHRLLETMKMFGLLCQPQPDQAVYRMHPALRGYLQSWVHRSVDVVYRREWTQVFVDVLARVAHGLTQRPLHEKAPILYLHEANFGIAAQKADQLDDLKCASALRQFLAATALKRRHFSESEEQYRKYLELLQRRGNSKGEAAVYHQLGIIAQERQHLYAAEQWYKKSIEIEEAEGDKHAAATSYHQLGYIEQLRSDIESAAEFYQKSMDIFREVGDEISLGKSCHHLGMLALERGDLEGAKEWSARALAIKEQNGDKLGEANAHNHLAGIARVCRSYNKAMGHYQKALALYSEMGHQQEAAVIVRQQGMVAQDLGDHSSAEKSYKDALHVYEDLDDTTNIGITLMYLGILAGRRQLYRESGEWFVKAFSTHEGNGDTDSARTVILNYLTLQKTAPTKDQVYLRTLWENAGLLRPKRVSEGDAEIERGAEYVG